MAVLSHEIRSKDRGKGDIIDGVTKVLSFSAFQRALPVDVACNDAAKGRSTQICYEFPNLACSI